MQILGTTPAPLGEGSAQIRVEGYLDFTLIPLEERDHMSGRPIYRNWLVVTHAGRHLPEVGTDRESQWCLKRDVKAGHHFFAYKTRTGITGQWKVAGLSAIGHVECVKRRLQTYDARRVRVFPNPLTYSDMLAIPELQNMWGLRGRFQGICFGIKDDEYAIIMEALKTKNS